MKQLKVNPPAHRKFSTHPALFRLQVVREYMAGGVTQKELGERYQLDRSLISTWIRRFAVTNELPVMSKKERKDSDLLAKIDSLERENRELQKALEQKDDELESATFRALAWETMVDVAEKELGIEIRKRPGSKQ